MRCPGLAKEAGGAGSTLAAAVAGAVDRGVAWLLGVRDPEGWWGDFDNPGAGPSDEWTTAYVGTVLGQLRYEVAGEAWGLLLGRQSPRGGWCFNRRFGVDDADSTAWALHLARVTGEEESEAAELARGFLRRHLRPDGGVATVVDLPGEAAGWTASHECVTAAVGAIPAFLPSVRWFLWSRQAPDGSWRSYWWTGREYATALASEALAAGELDGDRVAVEQAVDWALQRFHGSSRVSTAEHPNGSPFATAWCLRLLLLSARQEARQAALDATRWLLQAQRPNGFWAASADLLFPGRGLLDPHGAAFRFVPPLPEVAGVFTTATVLEALRRWAGLPATRSSEHHPGGMVPVEP